MKKTSFIFLLLFLTVYSFCNSKVHFSVDDVSHSLYDLTKNERKYSSAFDQPFFRYLKSLHDMYGVVVSLYCFYEQNGFTLEDCTDKFSEDFLENSSWLKFGYHAWNPNTLFNEEKNGYNLFIEQIKRIAGSRNSICRTVRLHYFSGNRVEILDISKNNELGINSLFCADSEVRESYYLNDNERNELNLNESIYLDDICFLKTDFRFDDYKNFERLLKSNINEEELIVFTHEWLLYVPVRKNIIKYFKSLRESQKIKSNIETFFSYCLEKRLMFVSEF